MEIHFFFHQRHALSMSFGIFVLTYRMTNVLPKLVYILLVFREKTEFSFLKSLFPLLPWEGRKKSERRHPPGVRLYSNAAGKKRK